MLITLFRNRMNAGAVDEYAQWQRRMSERARAMPGYISHKSFTAEDGERLTVVEFASEEAQRAWSQDPEHLEAKKLGRASFYSEYRLTVCKVLRDRRYPG